MSVEYVGPEHFLDMDQPLAGGHTEGRSEAAAVFVGWIDDGFPDEMHVASWAGPESHGCAHMRANDIVESAYLLLAVPLPMPGELASKVRDYVTAVPIEHHDYEAGEPPDWTGAIYDLKHALAWRQKHAAAV
jgi:hypothetical protein